MKRSYLLLVFGIAIGFGGHCQAVDNAPNLVIGGACEGCEAIYESPVPFNQLAAVDTLPDFNDPGPKLALSGIIFKSDGVTPAENVVLYIYHTNQEGIYPQDGNQKGWGKKHGYLRGWVKTQGDGRYYFYTLLPASYPNSKNPKHINPMIKEPGKNAYYIDEYLFIGDPFLNAASLNNERPRGGSGLLETYAKGGIFYATRNIILGLNIPGYPAK